MPYQPVSGLDLFKSECKTSFFASEATLLHDAKQQAFCF